MTALTASTPIPEPREADGPRLVAIPSFERVYEEHFEFVWRFIVHRGVPSSARDDVVQEVFLTVNNRLSSFAGQSSLRTWIGGIARMVARDYVRKKRNQPAAEFELDESRVSSSLDLPTEALEKKDASQVLDEILNRMPEPQREAFMLCELDQLSGGEAALLLCINENTLRTRLRAAREIFNSGVARHRAQVAWRERD